MESTVGVGRVVMKPYFAPSLRESVRPIEVNELDRDRKRGFRRRLQLPFRADRGRPHQHQGVTVHIRDNGEMYVQ